jgi:hypothetical protein
MKASTHLGGMAPSQEPNSLRGHSGAKQKQRSHTPLTTLGAEQTAPHTLGVRPLLLLPQLLQLFG